MTFLSLGQVLEVLLIVITCLAAFTFGAGRRR